MSRRIENYKEDFEVQGYRRESGIVIERLVPVSVWEGIKMRALSALPCKDKEIRIRVLS